MGTNRIYATKKKESPQIISGGLFILNNVLLTPFPKMLQECYFFSRCFITILFFNCKIKMGYKKTSKEVNYEFHKRRQRKFNRHRSVL
jgi:hypothetical protein